MLVQPGVDVAAPVARRPANLDECRPGPLLPPPFQRSLADLQLISELLLGQEFFAHLLLRWSAGRILPGRGGPRHKVTGYGGLRRILTGHDGEGRTLTAPDAARSPMAVGRPDAAPARCTKPPSGRAPRLLGRREDAVPEHDPNPDKPESAGEPNWRRLLDGYAEPGRLRRLRERQQQQRPGRLGRLARRLRWRPRRRA